MRVSGFEYTIDELDGYRLVRVVYPEVVQISKLSAFVASFEEVWDEDVPTVALSDVSPLTEISDELMGVAKFLFQRLRDKPCLVSACWIVGDNEVVRDRFPLLLAGVRGSEGAMFRTPEEGIEYLRARIRERESAK